MMITKKEILETLKTSKSKLRKLGIREVGLFGSYRRDEQSHDSDIDILIDFEPKEENFDNFMKVYDLLERLFQSEKIEIVTKNGLSPHIGPHILKEVEYA